MVDYLSDSAKRRLPAVIGRMDEKEQAAFVFLRMRKDGAFIARELDIPLLNANEMISNVQSALAATGALDLIRDPVFYPIDHPSRHGDDEGTAFQLAGSEMDIADQIALDQFYQVLKKSVKQMPQDGRRLLELWFNKEMSAKSILIFYSNIGANISSTKSIKDSTVQDVFYALEKNIRNLFDLVRTNMPERESELTPAALKEILKETGV